MGKYRVETEDGKVYEIETEDEIRVPAGQAQPGMMDNAGKFAGAFWEKVNPVEAVKGAWTAVTSPVETAKGIIGAHTSLASQAAEEYGRGNYGMAAQKALGAAIPLLGPDLERSVSQMEQGNVAEGLGGLGGTLAGMFIPGKIGKVPQVRLPVPGMNALNLAERSAIEFMQRNNIPLPGGTVGGSLAAKGIQKLGAVSPLGSYLAPKMEAATAAGLQRVSADLADAAHPQIFMPESAGQSVTKALGRKAEGLTKQADTEYEVLRNVEADPANIRSVQQGIDPRTNAPVMEDVPVPVDIRQLKRDIQPVFDHMTQWIDPAKRHASAGYQAMKTILDSKDFVPATVAEAGLGGLKELAREGTGRSAGLAKHIIPRFQDAIDDAVQQIDPNALTSLRAGRAFTAEAKGTEQILRRVEGNLGEPVQGYRRLVQPKDTGIELLRKVQRETPDELPKVGRAYLEDIFEIGKAEGGLPKRADAIFAAWDKLGEETKNLLYPNPLLRQNLNDFFLGVKKVAENPNPSGTAALNFLGAQSGISGGTYMVGGIVPAAVTAVIPSTLAAMMYTPRGVKLLQKGLTIPMGNKARAAAWANEVGNLAQQLTDEEKIRKQLGGKPMLPYEYANPAADPRRRR